MVRPLSDNKKSESPSYRMTKGELAMIELEASIEGVSASELVRRAVAAYKPTPRAEVCVECNKTMVPGTTEWELPLEVGDKKRMITIINVPVMKCHECGDMSHGLDIEISVDKLIDQLIVDALKHHKEIPDKMSIEELFEENYLGKN
jgi:hypothetical protein